MADDKMTPANASNILEAVRVLEELEKRGELTRTEQVALDRFRAKNGGPSQADLAREEDIKTRARYRGMASGATLNAKDEIWGAINALTGGTYAQGRDDVRQRDAAAKMLAPDEYGKGELAGIGATVALPFAAATKLTRGLSGATRALVGATEGGLWAALPAFMGGEGGFKERASQIDPFWTAVGAGLGGAVPLAGEIGAGIVRAAERARTAIPGYGSKATNVMSRAFAKAERGGEDVRAYLSSLGDEGMIADIPGAPRSTAQGVATMGGAGAGVISREISNRAANAGPRIEAAVDRVAGGPNLAYEAERARATQRSSVFGPLYDAAKASPDPIDVRAVTSMLTFARGNATGDTRAMYDNLLSELASPNGTVSAEKLHNVRVELSDAMSKATRAGAGGFVSNLKPVLDEIDARLDSIGGYATARGGWADSKALDRAAEEGRTVLTGGPTTVETPQRFAARWAKLTDAEKEATRAGVREYIASLMGTARNDPAAAWGQLADKGFNDAKLRILFGDEEAGFILNTLRGEKAFSETRGAVLQGSQTEMRRQAANDLGDIREPDTMQRPAPITRVKQAIFDNPVNAAIDSIVYGNRRSAANEEIGRLLTLRGAERDQAVQALLRVAMQEGVDTRKQKMVRMLAETLAGSSGAIYTNAQQDRR